MSPSRFNEVIQNRGHERAVKKIEAFKSAVHVALEALLPKHCQYFCAAEHKEILGILLSGQLNAGWPAQIWHTEYERVTKELLGTMDEMQKALVAPKPVQDANTPPAPPLYSVTPESKA